MRNALPNTVAGCRDKAQRARCGVLVCFAVMSCCGPWGWTQVAVGEEAAASGEAAVGWQGFQNGGALFPSDIPADWKVESSPVAWQAEIEGYGQSSPVVVSDQVYVTSTSGPNKERLHVAAFTLATGTKLWQRDFVNPSPEESSTYISRAAPSPVADASGIFAAFEGGLIVALTPAGETRFEKNLVAEYGPITARHGLAASLEQDAKKVYAWIERETEPYLLAIDKADGKVVWKAAGVGATGWSSPRLLSVDGKPQLVCSASGHIAGYDPENGDRLWDLTEISNNTTCTPIPVADGRFVIGASDGRGEPGAGNAAASNGLIEIKRQADGKYAANFVWRAEKATCSFGSPLVTDKHVWIVNRSGVLYQLDLATGQQLAAQRVSSGSVWATPIASRSRLYLFGQKGTASIVDLATAREEGSFPAWKDGPASKDGPVAGGQNPQGQGAPAPAAGPFGSGAVLYAAAYAKSHLLIRRGDTLFAYRVPG
jgi:outer membrane protein assembly factor BamB